jgi:uncharacterized protein
LVNISEKEKNNIDSTKTDRLLGDEWQSWSGNLDEGKSYNETAKLFTIYASFAVLIILGMAAVILYMVEPRLFLINPVLVVIARTITVILSVLFVILAAMITAGGFTGKNYFYNTRLGQIFAVKILPLALIVAQKLGISRDRLGNSFVAFSNAIVKSSHKPGEGKTIILIPRCLKNDLKKEIQEIAVKAGVGAFNATGGGQARKIILQEQPTAVIGIACERDLMSGICDIAMKLPTIGITNKRPEGPCKNTDIDIEKLKKAIETLTGKSLD